ncbi:MAG: hypothetical protein NT099_06845 [Candidatus Saganbacteria bacterium]|nr:hypothetical protein [Candidatus Saganbacteria bacterium]
MPEIKTIYFPDSYDALDVLRDEYVKNKYLLVSFERIKDRSEAKKLKDYLLGITYVKEGIAFQYGKTVLFSVLSNGDSKDTLKIPDWEG